MSDRKSDNHRHQLSPLLHEAVFLCVLYLHLLPTTASASACIVHLFFSSHFVNALRFFFFYLCAKLNLNMQSGTRCKYSKIIICSIQFHCGIPATNRLRKLTRPQPFICHSNVSKWRSRELERYFFLHWQRKRVAASPIAIVTICLTPAIYSGILIKY